jgi:hypothetical protein
MHGNVYSAFCKICELNTEREIVFVLVLLQNTEIIKQTDLLFGKSEGNLNLSRIYLAV